MLIQTTKILSLIIITTNFAFAENLKDELFRKIKESQLSLSYKDAKKKLFNEVFIESDSKGFFIQDVYCLDKRYIVIKEISTDKLPDPKNLNTEHTWPQSKFSNSHSRDIQKSDLHHLFPTLTKINSERGNLPFAEVNSTQDLSCEESKMGIPLRGDGGLFFEPPDKHKGNVARAMFYFSIRYQISIDSVQESYFKLWHKEDPVDESERKIHEKIFKIQKNRNPFIDDPTLVDKINDF